jgi:HlyD family secretion protein
MDIVRTDAAQSRRRKVAMRLVIAAVLVGIGGLALSRQRTALPSISRSQAWIDTVRRGALSIQVHGTGVLAPEDVQWIAAAAEGRIARVHVLPGTAVEAETVLVDIENDEVQRAALDAELQLRAAIADLENHKNQIDSALLAQEAVTATARADYEEARLRAAADADLAHAGLISSLTLKFSRGRETQLGVRVAVEEKRLVLARASRRTDLAASIARVDQLRALVALKRQQRDALHVRAGRAGVVQEVAVQAGQRVAGGAVLARVAAPQPLKAVVQISEVQASQIAAGQTVAIDTHEGVVTGMIARIDPAVRNGSVTIDVRLPHNLPLAARPDLSVDANIDIARIGDAVFVGRPVQADARGTIALFRLEPEGNTAVRTKVRVGRASYNTIEILGGLAPGDRVILSDTTTFDGVDRIAIVN